LQAFGIALDPGKNEMTTKGKTANIASESSRVKVLVIPTDEELSIAEQTLEVVSGGF
jgi:acetate kinase